MRHTSGRIYSIVPVTQASRHLVPYWNGWNCPATVPGPTRFQRPYKGEAQMAYRPKKDWKR
jgi:hypothetical protein